MLIAGEPGAGKSVGLNNVVAHAALSLDADLWLFDGKLVELGLWRSCAERFVGNDLDHALGVLAELTAEMDRGYDLLDAERRRKITTDDAEQHGIRPIVVSSTPRWIGAQIDGPTSSVWAAGRARPALAAWRWATRRRGVAAGGSAQT